MKPIGKQSNTIEEKKPKKVKKKQQSDRSMRRDQKEDVANKN